MLLDVVLQGLDAFSLGIQIILICVVLRDIIVLLLHVTMERRLGGLLCLYYRRLEDPHRISGAGQL